MGGSNSPKGVFILIQNVESLYSLALLFSSNFMFFYNLKSFWQCMLKDLVARTSLKPLRVIIKGRSGGRVLGSRVPHS